MSLPAGDLENIVRDLIRGFLNSDMTKLPDEKRLAFKQGEYSDELLKVMIEKIVYNDHKINTFIKVGNIDYLKNFQKQDYMNSANDPMEYYITTDGEYAVIETPLYLSTGTCLNQRHGGLEVELLTMDDNAQMLIKALSYGWKYKRDYENGVGIKTIAKNEQRDQRTIYKYLNLAYLSPRIITDIMNNDIPTGMNLQKLIRLASKYDKFQDQEKAFYEPMNS